MEVLQEATTGVDDKLLELVMRICDGGGEG
jgi:hypothetical protein